MKIIKNFSLIIFFTVISGLIAGKLCGDILITSVYKGNSLFFTFIFSPSRTFVDTYFLINNADEYKRLSGYYAYNESGIVDLDFLFERYKREDSEIIKKAIIWIAEENTGEEKLVDFYKKIYNISPENIKKILLTKMRK